MTIFIDNRGSGERDLAELLKKKHLAVEVRHLDSGDIVFGDVGIERKTVNDLLNSISGEHRHFWEQLKVLTNTYKHPFILIEGTFPNYNDSWLTGVFFSIILGWKVPVIPTYNLEDSAKAIKKLFLKYGRSKTDSPPPPVVIKPKTPQQIRWAMLQCVRGIGPKTAKRILAEINPFTYAWNRDMVEKVLEDKLKKVKGLNKNKREVLIQVFKGSA